MTRSFIITRRWRIREYLGPADPPSSIELQKHEPQWAHAVVKRVCSKPTRWKYAVEFLGAMLKPQDLNEMLLEWLLVDDVPLHWPDLLMRLARGGKTHSPVAVTLYRMMLLNGPLINKAREELAAQAYAHLYNSEVAKNRFFAEHLKLRLGASGRRWLRLVAGKASTGWPVFNSEMEMTSLASIGNGRIAIGFMDGRIIVWDPTTPEMMEFMRHEIGEAILTIACLEGSRLASGGRDGRICLFEFEHCGQARLVLEHGAPIGSLVWLSEKLLVSGGDDGRIFLWDFRCDNPQPKVLEHGSLVTSLTRLGETAFASVGNDDRICLWDLDEGNDPAFVQHGATHSHVWRGSGLASGGKDGRICLWNLEPSNHVSLVLDQGAPIGSLVWLSEKILVSGGDDGRIFVWDLNQVEAEPRIFTRGSPILSMTRLGLTAFASQGTDGRVCIWQLDFAAPNDQGLNHGLFVSALASPGGSALTSAG